MILQNQHRTGSARKGFTLTEILVVVAIIVVLAAIAVPITINVLSESKVSIARSHIKGTLESAVNTYAVQRGGDVYPTSLEDLVRPPDNGLPLLKEEHIIDPWRRPYQYAFPGQNNPYGADIWSEGPRPGDPTSIIGNWQSVLTGQ